jgi:hypothetical protein
MKRLHLQIPKKIEFVLKEHYRVTSVFIIPANMSMSGCKLVEKTETGCVPDLFDYLKNLFPETSICKMTHIF